MTTVTLRQALAGILAVATVAVFLGLWHSGLNIAFYTITPLVLLILLVTTLLILGDQTKLGFAADEILGDIELPCVPRDVSTVSVKRQFKSEEVTVTRPLNLQQRAAAAQLNVDPSIIQPLNIQEAPITQLNVDPCPSWQDGADFLAAAGDGAIQLHVNVLEDDEPLPISGYSDRHSGVASASQVFSMATNDLLEKNRLSAEGDAHKVVDFNRLWLSEVEAPSQKIEVKVLPSEPPELAGLPSEKQEQPRLSSEQPEIQIPVEVTTQQPEAELTTALQLQSLPENESLSYASSASGVSFRVLGGSKGQRYGTGSHRHPEALIPPDESPIYDRQPLRNFESIYRVKKKKGGLMKRFGFGSGKRAKKEGSVGSRRHGSRGRTTTTGPEENGGFVDFVQQLPINIAGTFGGGDDGQPPPPPAYRRTTTTTAPLSKEETRQSFNLEGLTVGSRLIYLDIIQDTYIPPEHVEAYKQGRLGDFTQPNIPITFPGHRKKGKTTAKGGKYGGGVINRSFGPLPSSPRYVPGGGASSLSFTTILLLLLILVGAGYYGFREGYFDSVYQNGQQYYYRMGQSGIHPAIPMIAFFLIALVLFRSTMMSSGPGPTGNGYPYVDSQHYSYTGGAGSYAGNQSAYQSRLSDEPGYNELSPYGQPMTPLPVHIHSQKGASTVATDHPNMFTNNVFINTPLGSSEGGGPSNAFAWILLVVAIMALIRQQNGDSWFQNVQEAGLQLFSKEAGKGFVLALCFYGVFLAITYIYAGFCTGWRRVYIR